MEEGESLLLWDGVLYRQRYDLRERERWMKAKIEGRDITLSLPCSHNKGLFFPRA